MAKNTEKQKKFIWKNKRSDLSTHAIEEIRNKIDSFNNIENCTLHNSSDLVDNLAALEECFVEKNNVNTTFFTNDLAKNYDAVNLSKFNDLCDALKQDKNTTAQDNVELTARTSHRSLRHDAYYTIRDYNKDWTVHVIAGFADDHSTWHNVDVKSGYNTTVNSSNWSTNYDSRACTGYYASDGCTTVYFDKFSVDKGDYESESNTDK